MVAYIYQKLLDEGVKAGQTPARTRSARNWFRNLARQTTGVQPNTIILASPLCYENKLDDLYTGQNHSSFVG